MKKIITLYDLDGVIADWEERALEISGVNKEEVIPQLKQGKYLEEIVPGIMNKVSDVSGFYEGLEIFPWAHELIDIGRKYGDVGFLTSSGNLYKRPETVPQVTCEKLKWISKHFTDVPPILGREKYLCASPNTILVDDTDYKVADFVEYGGQGFLFPEQYSIRDRDIKIEDVFNELEMKLQDMTEELKAA